MAKAEEMLEKIKKYITHLLDLSKQIIDFNIIYNGKTFSHVYSVDRDYCDDIIKLKSTNDTMLSFQAYVVKMNRIMKSHGGINNRIF